MIPLVAHYHPYPCILRCGQDHPINSKHAIISTPTTVPLGVLKLIGTFFEHNLIIMLLIYVRPLIHHPYGSGSDTKNTVTAYRAGEYGKGRSFHHDPKPPSQPSVAHFQEYSYDNADLQRLMMKCK